MNCSTPGFPVLHYLPEFAQTHIHWVSDAIQPSHPLTPSSPTCPQSFPASGSFPTSQLCTSGPKCWSFSISSSSEYSELILFRIDWFDLFAVQGTLKSSPVPQFESINSSPLSLLYDPTLTFIHEYWKNLVHRWLFFPASLCGGRVKGALCGLL